MGGVQSNPPLPKDPSRTKNSTESKVTSGRKNYGNSKTPESAQKCLFFLGKKRQENGVQIVKSYCGSKIHGTERHPIFSTEGSFG